MQDAVHFTHSAFLYDSPDDYRDFLVHFIREGVERGDAIAMAAPADRVALMRAALGPDATHVRFQRTEDWQIRPVRSIGVWSRLLRTAATAGRPSARLINEIDFQDQTPSWVRAESASNASLAGLNGHLLCPYDRSTLPPDLITAARRTHPVLFDARHQHSDPHARLFDARHQHNDPDAHRQHSDPDAHRQHSHFDARRQHSDEFVEPGILLAGIEEPPYPVSGPPLVEVPVADSVADLRAHLRNRATAEGWLPPDRVEVLILALNELATNGIRHGGAHRELRVWLNPDAVVCEVADDGPAPPGPLAGYLPPVPGVVGGMGLWLVGQICDALSVTTADGVTRARFALRR